MRINRRKIANGLREICKRYHERIPLGDILTVAKDSGLNPIQEDGTPWSGFLCGDTGEALIELDGVENLLVINWYRMESGRFEVNVYLS